MYFNPVCVNLIKDAPWRSKILEMVIKLLLPECKEENILEEDFLAEEEEVLNEKAWNFRLGHPKQVSRFISVRPLRYKLF